MAHISAHSELALRQRGSGGQLLTAWQTGSRVQEGAQERDASFQVPPLVIASSTRLHFLANQL